MKWMNGEKTAILAHFHSKFHDMLMFSPTPLKKNWRNSKRVASSSSLMAWFGSGREGVRTVCAYCLACLEYTVDDRFKLVTGSCSSILPERIVSPGSARRRRPVTFFPCQPVKRRLGSWPAACSSKYERMEAKQQTWLGKRNQQSRQLGEK